MPPLPANREFEILEPAAKRLVDSRDTEGKAAGVVLDSGGLLEGC